MITRDDKGRRIKILNTNLADWLEVGSTYTIKEVITENVVEVGGEAWQYRQGDYLFTDKPIKSPQNEHIVFTENVAGDEVVINKKYQSFRAGDTAVIEEVLDDERIKVKGCLPGGFIYKRDVIRKYDFSQMRLSTKDELFLKLGVGGAVSCFARDSKIYKMTGKLLSEIGCIQKGNNIIIQGTDEGIPLDIIRKASEPPEQCVLYSTISSMSFTDPSKSKLIVANIPITQAIPELTVDYVFDQLVKKQKFRVPLLDFNFNYNSFMVVKKEEKEENLPF